MDTSYTILGCLVLIQMTVILVMLNPLYDVRRITKHVDRAVRRYRTYYFLAIAIYFGAVVYLGMYTPLRHIHHMLCDKEMNEYDKLVVLAAVEKNYIIAGFSLFLFVVAYGVRALLAYASSLLEVSIATRESIVFKTQARMKKKGYYESENILPNLLRVKRSVSYETILFANELREQLKAILKNAEFPHNSGAISSILDSGGINSLWCS